MQHIYTFIQNLLSLLTTQSATTNQREKYLSQATDIYDLENRMRKIERNESFNSQI